MLKLYGITVEHETSPMSAPVANTRFGWKLDSDNTDVFQKSYRITAVGNHGDRFDTGVVESADSNDVVIGYEFRTGEYYTITVTVTDNHGDTAAAESRFHTEIKPEEWAGKWIKPEQHIEGWAPYIRTKFELSKNIKEAILYASGLGCGEYYINGKKISEDLIDPPFTNYEKEVFYRAYDVTDYLSDKNCFAALLGEGWYSQSRVWAPSAFKYGDVCLCAQIKVEYEDGTIVTIATDDTWKYKYSPIVLNNLYGGETYDSRLETPDFADYNGGESCWGACKYDDIPKGALKGCLMPPVRIIRKIPAVSVRQASGCDDGAWIIDLGENFAGFAEFKLRNSPRGAQYVFRFAETLNEGGNLDFRSIGSFATQCIQQDVYIARGDRDGEVWRPRFTYHGFRYIEITGYHDLRKYGSNPDIEIAVGYALSTDLKQSGKFECDHSDLMRLQEVMLRTFRSNYHGFPEDCPAREKCGWLGDAEVVCNYGMMNYDLRSSYEKYMSDIRTEDEVYGVWQMIAPGKRGCGEATPLWGCAQVIIPYWMYKYYGDAQVVRDNWSMMKKWIRHELDRSEDYLIDVGLGDWCPPVGNNGERRIPVIHSSTMMFYETCKKMQELAEMLSLDGADYYGGLAEKIKESIIRNFYKPDAHTYGYWGSNGVALTLGIYPDGDRAALVRATVEQIKADRYEMSTGIYANKYLVPVLCEEGYGDEALKFLFNEKYTSFRTMLDDNATSLWECLEMHSVEKNRSKGVASYNHPMHSGFAYFCYSCIAGIKPLEPGFRSFEIKPCRFESVKNIDAVYETPYGTIGIRIDADGYKVKVPANTVCRFYKYGADTPEILTSGEYSFKG